MIESNLDPWPVEALQATLELSAPDAAAPTELPPLWHWLYFLSATPRSALGPDGYMVNQEWVDSALRRRRLFAAARTEFLRPLAIGRRAQMTENVLRRRDTQGRSGPIHILTVECRYVQDGVLCVREERDIVYLQGAVAAQPAASEQLAVKNSAPDSWVLTLTPDPVLLMRFSALTFNSHLIHFDSLYTQREEGYPERVVQGPLVAIVLAQLLQRNGYQRIARFEFRARSPLYVNLPIQFVGVPHADRVELLAFGTGGSRAMEATAWLAT